MRIDDGRLETTVGGELTCPSVPLLPDDSTGQLAGVVALLGRLETAADDQVRIDRIVTLERIQAAAAAAQAREIAAFADSQEDKQRRAGVSERRLGVGVADQVALACKVSPVTGARRVGFARQLTGQLPETFGLLARGEISAWAATLVARETVVLSPAHRREADRVLAGVIASLSPRQVEAAARRVGIRLDPNAAVRRGRTARSDRRVSIRPAPDTMALLTGYVPCEQGIAAWVSLDRDARARRHAGDPRSLGEIMADTLIERLTGQATAAAVPVEIGITMTADALLDPTDPTPASLTGYGPVPAALARHLAGDAHAREPERRRARVFVRRIVTDPVDHTVTTIDTRRRRFHPAQARCIGYRDQHCRTPYCTAPIRHYDHVVAHRDGGRTSVNNGQGLCERHSYVKEAPGWQTHLQPAGSPPDAARRRHTTVITTPTGHTYRSLAPPALGNGG